MPPTLVQFLRAYEPIEVAVELAIIWGLVYLVMRFLEGTRGTGVLRGFAVLAIVVAVGVRVGTEAVGGVFERVRFIFEQLFGLLAIVLIVVFQPELRQGMVRLSEIFSRSKRRTSALVDEIDAAVQFLSKNQFGALLVFERDIALTTFTEGGVHIDAVISARLIESIFYPNSPLHDLAVVIRGDRVVAANVQLPLADVGVVSAELGSRHRAAVGVSVETDCIVVVVSEERGTIRLAQRGTLTPPIPRDQFPARLAAALDPAAPTEAPAGLVAPTTASGPAPATGVRDAPSKARPLS